MAILRDKPYTGMNFLVDLGTGQTEGPDAGLLEVIFPEARVQVLEYRNGNDKSNEVIRTQTLARYGHLILKRGVIGSLTWYQWWSDVRNGNRGVRNILVSLLNEDHSAVVLNWKFFHALPVTYHFSPLNALGCEAFTETLEIVFERFEME